MKSLYISIVLLCCLLAAQAAVRRDTAVLTSRVTEGFRDNCYPKASGGCKCEVNEGHDDVTIREYDNVEQCKKPVEVQTALNKMALNKEIQEKFGDFKENCFPKPSGGCKCNVDLGQGETVMEFSDAKDCRKSIEAETAENKKKLNEEIAEKFGNFKENCFPKPSGGCKCTEKDSNGNEVSNSYNNAEQCRELIPPNNRGKRDTGVQVQRQPAQLDRNVKDRSRSPSVGRPNYDVRDPVRERAQQNYAAVLDELHNKFKGLKEGCFPRPKGCLCVTGKTADGRDITQRYMSDADCKCKPGEKGPQCPAA